MKIGIKRMKTEESGQALVELSFSFVILCMFAFGVVDFGRAIYDVQVMRNLAGEGSSMASRQSGQNLALTANTVVNYAGADLDMAHKGCVIVTVVTNSGGTLHVTDQAQNCNITATTKIGCVAGTPHCGSDTPTLPDGARTALLAEVNGSSIAVTEIYYTYAPITPIMTFLRGRVLPSQLYTVAYY